MSNPEIRPEIGGGPPRLEPFFDGAERLLASASVRLVLSALIILSVLPSGAQRTLLPDRAVGHLNGFFLAVFGLELLLRAALFVRSWRRRRARGSELLLLGLDLLAVVSFLPLGTVIDSGYLRLVRLGRMLLLFGYWGQAARELLAILIAPERRYQVVMVLLLGLALSFGSAVVVTHLVPEYDYDGDGRIDPHDRDFFRVLWWSFRQVEDPGNLVSEIDRPPIVAVSVLLTLAGLLLFSFLIGIGTGAIEELLVRLREQPVGFEAHTVVLGLTSHCVFLLEGLAEIYKKNLRPFRVAVLGTRPEAPAYLHRPLLRAFQYRSGDPVRAADLDRVDVQRAKRVLILGAVPEDPDGEVVAALLATRERNPEVDVYPDVEHERNFRAVRAAGGPRTHLVGSGSFLGHYLVQNAVYPGAYRLYRHLLSSSGCEIYTYVFFPEERRRLLVSAPVASSASDAGATLDPAALHRLAYRRHGVNLLGLFVADDEAAELEDQDLRVLLNPAATPPVPWGRVRGLIGVALRWADLRRLAHGLVESPSVAPAPDPDPSPSRAPDPLGAVTLDPARPRLDRVLICGDSLRVPRVVTELAAVSERLEATVLVPDPLRFRALARTLGSTLADQWGPPSAAERRDGSVDLRWERAAGARRILFLEAEWTDRRRLREAGAVELESADAVLFLPGGSRAEELDGGVALDCLHVANLARSGEVTPRPWLHVLGMVSDPVKGELLESRLARRAGVQGEPRFTVISSERARHHYIMQNVFVRGLNPVYLELLRAGGQHLARVVPRDPDGRRPTAGTVDPGVLMEHLLARRLVLVGLELVGLERDGGEARPRIELDPRELQPGGEIPWSRVRALYLLGDVDDVAGSGSAGCKLQPRGIRTS